MKIEPLPRILIGSGLLLIFVGLLWQWGGKTLPLGKLPGDIVIEKENFRFYFPVVTSLLLSGLISVVLFLIRYFCK